MAGSEMLRPDLYVVARILECLWRAHGPILRTRLQIAANVNYDVFSRYIDWMSQKGLVTYDKCSNGHDGVKLTSKGEEAYRKLVQWINEVINGKM
ncbi:MAG: winged helix-turn-helix domain-containing protein [Methanomassiliicoccales archaeon]|jgi:predicted transcriptional regulator